MNKHKNPEIFHKKSYEKCYFEGWYYKQVTKDGKHTISFIPGASFKKGKDIGFIQCIHHNEKNELNVYHMEYPIDKFITGENPFYVQIDKNRFSLEQIHLNMHTKQVSITGEIELINLTPIRTTWLNPNIMGFFSYIPFMECNHGVISMNHTLKGKLRIDGETVDFTGGKGYIEKDWGRSFPRTYTWVQSNHFEDATIGLFCAVATIPFVAFSFTGFICNLVYKGVEYRFATYNGTRLIVNEQSKDGVRLVFKNKDYRLEVKGKVGLTKKLLAPKMGAMDKMIKEGLAGVVEIALKDGEGHTILKAKSYQCGIEVVEQLQSRE